MSYSYFLGNSAITEVPHTKYLRVTIDQKLSWNEHTQKISSKANQVNSFLRRNLHQCPVNVKYNPTESSKILLQWFFHL